MHKVLKNIFSQCLGRAFIRPDPLVQVLTCVVVGLHLQMGAPLWGVLSGSDSVVKT